MRDSIAAIDEYRADTKPIAPKTIIGALAAALENGGALLSGSHWIAPVLVGAGKLLRKLE